MGRLTTHVLDIAHGRPGKSVAVSLHKIVNNSRQLLLATSTNADGRCDAPLLEGTALQPGVYELDFAVGAYFGALGVAQTQPPFLDIVTLSFVVADASPAFPVPQVGCTLASWT